MSATLWRGQSNRGQHISEKHSSTLSGPRVRVEIVLIAKNPAASRDRSVSYRRTSHAPVLVVRDDIAGLHEERQQPFLVASQLRMIQSALGFAGVSP